MKLIKGLRAAQGLRQYDLAKALGCSQSKYCLIENGRVQASRREEEIIAQTLGVPRTLIFPAEQEWRSLP